MPAQMTATMGQLESLAAAARNLSSADSLDEALAALARAAAAATGATLAVVRVRDGTGGLPARGVWSTSTALAAELEGSRLVLDELGTEEQHELEELPRPIRRLAERSGSSGVLVVPALDGDGVAASLELMRPGEPFSATERMLAQIAVHHAALLVRAFESANGAAGGSSVATALELAGRALTAGTEEARSAERIARLAAELTGAESCLLWRAENGVAQPLAAVGLTGETEELARASERELGSRTLLLRDDETKRVALVRLGEPPL